MSLDLSRNAAIGTMALALFLFTLELVSLPAHAPPHLGYRGLMRKRAASSGSAWAQCEPLVRWLGTRIEPCFPSGLLCRIERALSRAGDPLGLTPHEAIALSVLSACAGLGLGFVLATLFSSLGPLLLLGCAGASALLPYFFLAGEAARRSREIARGLPYAIDLMALGMSAGLDFPGAVRQYVERSSDSDDPLVMELGRLLRELELGKTRRQALLELAERVPLESLVEFVMSVVQAEERGNPVADILVVQASVARTKRSVAVEEAAAKAGVEMTLPLFLLFGSIMLLVVAPIVLKLASAE